MCSVNSFALTDRPASSNATFNPASDRRFAAQPPVAPEPTTITSYICCSGSCAIDLGMFFVLVFAAFIGAMRELTVPPEFFLTYFGSVVGIRNQPFEPEEVLLRGGRSTLLSNPGVNVCRI